MVYGLVNIRAYGVGEVFLNGLSQLIDQSKRNYVVREGIRAWFGLRVAWSSYLLSFFSIIFSFFWGRENPSIAGLLLSFSMYIEVDIMWLFFLFV